MLLWAAVCAPYESNLPKDVWRRRPSSRKSETENLAHLIDLGYTPCDTKTRMIADLTSDDVQDDAADLDDDLDGPTTWTSNRWRGRCRPRHPPIDRPRSTSPPEDTQ